MITDLLIVCADADEFEVYKSNFEEFSIDSESIVADVMFGVETIRFDLAVRDAKQGSIAVVATMCGNGLLTSKSHTALLVSSLKPTVVAMTGCCSGGCGFHMGDIVLVNEVHAPYSNDNTFEAAPLPRTSGRWKNVAQDQNVCRFAESLKYEFPDKDELRSIYGDDRHDQDATVHTGALCSYDVNLTSDTVVSCVTDSSGFSVAAVARNFGLPWLIVKAIHKFESPERSTNGNTLGKHAMFREFCCHASRFFLLSLVRTVVPELNSERAN